MYEYIKGKIADISPTHVIIDNNDIGYQIIISLNTYSLINGKEAVKLFLHQVVREDAHLLYGFSAQQEREIFQLLLSVNGVGASTAIMVLSSMTPEEITMAISTENVNALKAVKGIGAKTAQRIIIDLKDKLGKIAVVAENIPVSNNTIYEESLSALVMLGFSKRDAGKTVTKILKEQPNTSVEGVIKQALKRL